MGNLASEEIVISDASDPSMSSLLVLGCLGGVAVTVSLFILTEQGVWSMVELCLLLGLVLSMVYIALHKRGAKKIGESILKVTNEGIIAGGRLHEWRRFRSFKAKYPFVSLRLRVPMRMYWQDFKIEDRKQFESAVFLISKHLARKDDEIAVF
jgi:hypothetical protein